jgi:hypothetical protein
MGITFVYLFSFKEEDVKILLALRTFSNLLGATAFHQILLVVFPALTHDFPTFPYQTKIGHFLQKSYDSGSIFWAINQK